MKTFIIDIDGTICNSIPGGDYSKAIPIQQVIDKINFEYSRGNKIILYTARGMRTFSGDVFKISSYHGPILETWLAKYNVRYHDLVFGKMWSEGELYYIDDRNLSINEFMELK